MIRFGLYFVVLLGNKMCCKMYCAAFYVLVVEQDVSYHFPLVLLLTARYCKLYFIIAGFAWFVNRTICHVN